MSIPKIIHYCWLSGDPFPQEIQRCIDSWHRYMPDYEFKLWDTHNFDCGCRAYTRQALSMKKYAFVSDVVRLYALYTEGGIYLDSDIKVFRSFDDLLYSPAFSGIESGGRFAAWLMGSEPSNPLFKELLAYYDEKEFLHKDGSMDLTPNTIPTTRTLAKHGMVHENRVQKLEHITIYPEEYFCPKNPWTGRIIMTENTYAMHMFAGAWNDTAVGDLVFFGDVAAYVKAMIASEKINLKEPVYIFGTGTVGNLVLEALRMNQCEPEGFIVSKRDNAWTTIDGVKIFEISECNDLIKDSIVLISVLPKGQRDIHKILTDNGFKSLYGIGEYK